MASLPGDRSMKAVVVLDDGRVFEGASWGAVGEAFGEAVFSTGMTGYQETLTDPSYHRQIVVMTAPHIGNTGMNSTDEESDRIWVSGFIVRDPARTTANHRSEESLDDSLIRQGVVGAREIDTRALTRHLRDRGAMRMGIFSGGASELTKEEMLKRVRQTPEMLGASLASEVSTLKPYQVGSGRLQVAALDLGIKRNTPREFANFDITTTIYPADSSIPEIFGDQPDGFFVSNGPGDPATAYHAIALVQEALRRGVPFFGICFGHQIFSRAIGLETYKLRFGHRGLNQPVQEISSGRISITSHNHGFAVKSEDVFETPFGKGRVTHRSLNDGVVEGIALDDVPAFSVQYHPEAAAGPHDALELFKKFFEMIGK